MTSSRVNANATAAGPDALEQRVTELELKLTYADDLLDTLNLTVARQQATIDALVHELRSLRDQLGSAAQGPTFRSLRDELPPHY